LISRPVQLLASDRCADRSRADIPAQGAVASPVCQPSVLACRFCAERKLTPDTVLIDGRFRAACFLATAASVTESVTVLFDDYKNRKYYHWVEEIVAPTEMVGGLAVFKVEPGTVDAGRVLSHVSAFMDPR
jgi:hypothetical protein